MKDSLFLKVILWRICSILITLTLTWIWTGDIRSASGFTLFLHTILITAHWTFENTWNRFVSSE